MSEEIFRQKSLDKVKSPENLDDYIRVSNPGVWLLLISVILLLAGACVWGIFGHIDDTVKANVHAENGEIVCYVSDDDIYSVKEGMVAQFDDYEAVVTKIEHNDEHGYVCTLQSEHKVQNGVYEGKIVIESIKPLSFILN